MTELSHISEQRLTDLTRRLEQLRNQALKQEKAFSKELKKIHSAYRASARNLLHYLSIRQQDIRSLQTELSELGLSSLGQMEAHTLARLEAVLDIFACISHPTARDTRRNRQAPVSVKNGSKLLSKHAEILLGPSSPRRTVRTMVTMPREAASEPQLLEELLDAGMNIMRINCAHDEPEIWAAMIDNLRKAERKVGRQCRILADLGGQKLRTGSMTSRSRVLKIKPQRDYNGIVTDEARVSLVPESWASTSPNEADGVVELTTDILRKAQPGDRIELHDTRGKRRQLRVVDRQDSWRLASTKKTVYINEGMKVRLRRKGRTIAKGKVTHLPRVSGAIVLFVGDSLILTRGDSPGRPAVRDHEQQIVRPARVSCSLGEVFDQVQIGQRICFNDGTIGGIISASDQNSLTVNISHAREEGSKLRENQGINLPETDLKLPALTKKDIEDLQVIAPRVDMIGFSFVRTPEDVLQLATELQHLKASHLGVILKIENRIAFENLPRLLLAGLQSPPLGVMVARGDLAVEVGFDRLAEVQEEILWLCEAAHIPVIWATQVLEGYAKSREPTRAEVSDAAMSGRAECVMMNKGPHIIEAVEFLNDILERMEDHQKKKTSMLRKLSVSEV